MTDTNNISDADINAIVASIISDLHLENFTLDSTDTLSSTAPIEDIQLKKNPESVLVEESTSRFSDAIWYKKVREQTVILAGLGGIGSYVAYLLSRVKVNKLILYDDDTISLVNMAGQLYSKAQIGQPKVAAMNQIAQDFSDYFAVETLNEKYTEDSMVGPIMICGFDNMAARNLFFHKWKSYVDTLTEDEKSKALFIDGRLNAEEFQIFSISGDNTYAMDIYERQYLFSDIEVADAPCSYKQTSFIANMIASVMVNVFINFVANQCNPFVPRDVPFLTKYDASTMYFKVIS